MDMYKKGANNIPETLMAVGGVKHSSLLGLLREVLKWKLTPIYQA